MESTGASETASSPPSGTGFTAGLGEAFSLDLNSGQATYAIPFDLPDGIAGFRPRIRLEYSHARGNGAFGHGWSLQIREIGRRLDDGLSALDTREVFLDGPLVLHARGDGTFAPERETGFTHYRRDGDHWVVTERDGRRFVFGESEGMRITDPATPDRPIAWLLEREEDACGNAAVYTWRVEDGWAYPASIAYATYRVDFAYKARPDPVLNGRAGFLRRIGLRCTAIELRLVAGDELLRRLALGYAQDPATGRSVLEAAQLSGHRDGQPAVVKPPLRFDYSRFDPDAISVRLVEAAPGSSQPPPLDDPDTTLVVLDDLPLPGVLSQRNGRHVYWPNRGDGSWGHPRIMAEAPFGSSFAEDGVQLLDMDGTGRPDMLVGIGGNPLNGYYPNAGPRGFGTFVAYPAQERRLPPFESGRVRLGDLDGDGVVDALYSTERGLVAYRNAGRAGWAEPSVAAAPEALSLSDPLTFLADMTGDGLPDLVRVRSGLIEYFVNLGRGRFGERIVMASSPRLPEVHANPDQILLVDVNGDGCADLVRVSEHGIELWLNRGGAGFSARHHQPVVPQPISGTIRTADFLGRGAAGLIYNTRRGGEAVAVHYSWSPERPANLLTGIDGGTGLVSRIDYAPATEMALGDRDTGRPWTTVLPFPLWVVAATEETDRVRDLTVRTEYRYRDGHFDPLFRRFQGFAIVEKREIGDTSRADVLTRHRFLMNQAGQPGAHRDMAHLDRMLAEVEVFSLDGSPDEGRPLRREETDYAADLLETMPDGARRVFVSVSASRRIYTDRTDDARVEERRFTYDAFGNVVREEAIGHGTRDGAPAEDRSIVTEVAYATDAEQSRFAVARVVKRDGDGGILVEARHFYDGLPAGQMSRGLKTREMHLVLPRADFDAHYAGMDPASLGCFEAADAAGRPAVFALEVERTHSALGHVLTERTGVGRLTESAYDGDGLYLVTERVNGKEHRRVNDPATGKPLELISASGARVRMRYDAFGRMTHYMVADDTEAAPTRLISYDDASVPMSRTLSRRIDATTRGATVTYFDGRGKEVQSRVERAPGEVVVSPWLVQNPWAQTVTEYEPTLEADLAFAPPDLAGRARREASYDGLGRPISSRNYNGGTSRMGYTPFRITLHDALDDVAGHAQQGTPRVEEVDVWNQRTLIRETTAGATVSTHYRVGLLGEVREIADDAGRIVAYTYDRRGNRLKIDHRDAGLRAQWFNAANEIVRTRDGRGNDVEIVRDGEGRVTEARVSGLAVEAFVYDDANPEADGRLVEAVYPDGAQRYGYSARGHLVRHEIDVVGDSFAFALRHDDIGRQVTLKYPDGTEVTRAHSLNGLVTRIEGIIDRVDYDARNLPVRVLHANGVETRFDYEPGVGHLRSQRSVGPNGNVIEDVGYGYDALMQLVRRDDAAPGGTSAIYDYDGLGQLVRAEMERQGASEVMNYDYAAGHSLARIGESGVTLAYNDAAHPNRPSSMARGGGAAEDVMHDACGNVVAVGGRRLDYDFKNRLEAIHEADGTVIRYAYDYRGNRVLRLVEAAGVVRETVYLGRLVEVRGGHATNFVVMDQRRVALMRGGERRWIHSDQVGSATLFTDESGTRIAEVVYLPFGTERARAGTPLVMTYGRHDIDEVTGLVYMGHRWYAPDMGRFLTPDPLYLHQPERADDAPVKLRLYTYAGNGPVDRTDPMGLSFWSVVGAVVGVIVGIVVAIAVVAAFATGISFGLLAIAGVIALLTVSYVVADANQGTGIGEFFRGFMIGLNAGMNATFLAMMGPVGAFLGGFLGTLIFLSAVDSIASNEIYQGILGWSNWLMPMSWLVVGVGAIMWILNGLGHLFFWSIPSIFGGGIEFFRIDGFRMDWSTGMLATRGGWVSNLNTIDTAYNMGNFAYVDTNSAGWHLDHEAGHNLNLAVYGSIFHFIGFIHEMGAGAGAGAFSEVQADSNDGGPGMWS
ncbi:toxin TcdB middle/N-terminal domain-containing protein [Roseitranquillus sediminis]|uniref:toxin TcdB middle/N-terminal domain-containing protein n=1 Tax=Roseitranquillus sediminis TaxID=2809051 RepID=UPI001D0CC0A9|nr:toxin TcdB middle/N-terminal domain-containing protein [Roseitranquillus sediminis]MBM9593825.1 VCBS repeat-containing protein [Roseitranquillus sediminis]